MLPAGSLNDAMLGPPAARAIPALVLLEAVVALHCRHAALDERVDRHVDVVDREVQDRVGRGREVRLRVR